MQFLSSLFGGSENTLVGAAFALGIVLLLIVASVWLLKFVFRAAPNAGWNRSRLMIVDRINLDPKRQLVIVRRDNVEHVLLTGGPQDMIVETGIAVEKSAPRRVASIPAAVSPHAPRPNPFLEEAREDLPKPQSAIERLKDFTRPLNRRTPSSLRHTGLMRGVGKMEVIAGSGGDHGAHDSAKTPVVVDKGLTRVGEAGFPRDEAKAGGH
jgi:hypothetical protein